MIDVSMASLPGPSSTNVVLTYRRGPETSDRGLSEKLSIVYCLQIVVAVLR